MSKIRVIIFGATELSIRTAQCELDFENIDIVAFSDNNRNKCGVFINDIPIIRSEEITNFDYEYILVSAWRSYNQIKEQLLLLGISEEKIDLLYTEKIPYLYPDEAYIRDCAVLRRMYRNSDLIIEKIQKTKRYTKLWKEYADWEPMRYGTAEWCCKGTMIAHACGGIVNGKKHMYSNSKEAFADSLQKGFQLIECDAYGMINGEVVLAHDDRNFNDGRQGVYTLQTFAEFYKKLRQYPEVSALVDIKWVTQQDYREIVDAIDKDVTHEGKQQIILEVYDEQSIIYARKKGYECFYTQYRNPKAEFFIKTVAMCYKYGIKAVGFSRETALAPISNYFKIFTDKNIKIFIFSTDSIDEYAEVMSKGVSGVFTNYLRERAQYEYSTYISGRSGSEDA
ncbi:MAG: hypothetical protein NC434_02150 [Ruminococcus sp.]|nr:hypothetical protein [Ruminococcus sp.]